MNLIIASREIFDCAGLLKVILDLACGLNPFSLPWMALPPSTRYIPQDRDCVLVDIINSFLTSPNRKPCAVCSDLLSADSQMKADMVFLFKVLPSLEQQGRGAVRSFLRSLDAGTIVASFPTRSLGGRQRGMTAGYERFMEGVLEDWDIGMKKIIYPSEIFFLLQD